MRFLVAPFAALLRILRAMGRALFGTFAWSPPPWVQRSGSAIRNHRRTAAVTAILLVLLTGASIWTWRWYERQPKPHKVSATVRPIPVTLLEQHLKFPLILVEFSDPAARLEDLQKPALQQVQLDPAHPGAWKWRDDRTLVFEPSEDWPAGTNYQTKFEKKFFPPHVRMERLQYETATPAFAAEIKSVALTEDVKEPGAQRMITSVEFTHAVDPRELEKHVAFDMLGGSNVFAPDDPPPHFTIEPGMHNRQAFVRSSPFVLPAAEDWLRVTINRGLRTLRGEAELSEPIAQKTVVPSRETAFQIGATETGIVRNKEGEPEQMLTVTTTGDINIGEVAKALRVFLLPPRPTDEAESAQAEEADNEEPSDESDSESEKEGEDEEENDKADKSAEAKWANADEVTEEILAEAQPVTFTGIPTDKEQARDHHFRIRPQGEGQLFVRVEKGLRGVSGYELAQEFKSVIDAPALPQEITIQGDGGLLALGGERKVSIQSRGVPVIKFEIDRVASTQINHLVSQTEGEFQAPEFRSSAFDEENISRIAHEDQPINLENNWKANYSAFDFSRHLQKPADGGSERGLFFLRANGWDPATKKPIKSATDTRFILVTDLGLIVKKNADMTSDVFVASIKNGQPLAGVTVDLLGRNGIPVGTGKTSPDGRVSFASVEKNERERKPVVYVARLGDDVSFIPYDREDRMLNFSRFDIDGVTNVLGENLDAFVFTERGVYRPGDEMHIGFIVKQRNWRGQLTGLPVETEVIDAREMSVQTRKLTLPAGGFAEISYQTAYESPSGEYTINVYLVKNDKRSTLLGSTSVNVKEFLPDRMKIETRLSKEAGRGWMTPEAVRASIALANLYGTPASDRRVKSRVDLLPAAFKFPEFREYTFYDALLEEKQERNRETVDLGEQRTDTEGRAEVDLQLERFAHATYAMRFYAEAFEGEGGRSITGQASAIVSALPHVIGHKSDGDLSYIQAGTPRVVDLLAIDPQLNRIALNDITLDVIAQEYISVVTKKPNGSYAYESVLKERVAHSEKIAIAPDGLRYTLPTAEPGDYVLELRDGEGSKLTKVRFAVVGRGAAQRSLDRNSELQVKLERTQYNTGEEIAISITAPYAGTGLITIERDKVYAQRWFKADAASSVQRIRVPEGFEGSGYVNVALVRPLNSKEIFTSPLSYGVVPFTANAEKRRLKIDLQTADVAKPGEPLRIGCATDRPSRIAVFAVDEGILQVSDYKLPDPLGFFFRKCALSVETGQIMDLIMPEFSVLRSMSAFGGDGDEPRQLNPFRRVTEKPVVFWSGIIDAGPDRREVVYDVPDYFSGTLTVMAVAVSDDATGAAEREALIRGPFVITPSVPVLAAPGDRFEVGVTIANNVEGSGENAEVQIRAETSEHLQIAQAPATTVRIAEGREQSITVPMQVNDKLGSGTVTWIASAGGKESRLRSTISVRPSVPLMTSVRGGSFAKGNVDVPITRDMYPEFRKLSASISALPLGLAHGLEVYLKEFPHTCSEQIASAALARLLLADEADFGLTRAEAATQVENAFAVLRRRQNDKGAFGYWTVEQGDEIDFMSVYATHFLLEAKATGFAPPAEMLASALRHLQALVTKEPSDLEAARIIAYAIYLLTREGVITTNYIINLRDYLDSNFEDEWQRDLAGVYLAGALRILRKEDDAAELIARYRIGEHDRTRLTDSYQPLGADAQYLAVLAREFPEWLKRITAAEFDHIVRPISSGDFNTLSAAYAVLALKTYSQTLAKNPPELRITEIGKDRRETQLTSGAKLLQRSAFSGDAAALRFSTPATLNPPGAFYQVIESGFDRNAPDKVIADGLEVYRELLDKDGKPVTRTQLGEAVNVRVRLRSVRPEPITNVALVDLLPGGFEVVGSSLQSGAGTVGGVDFVEVREDRAVFYATAPTDALQIDYQIKSTSRGEFVVPPVFAEAMYDRTARGRGTGGRLTVVGAQ